MSWRPPCAVQLAFCSSDTDNGQVQLRIATDGNAWQLGVPYNDNGPVKGQWGFDGWEDEATFQTHGDGWATMDVSQHILDSLRQMDNFSIEIDRGPQHFPLRGSSAALKKATECARNQGKAPAKPAVASGGKGGQGGGVDWVRGRTTLPFDSRALPVGMMPDGMGVFVCAGRYNGGLHPGMAGMWIEGCNIGYGGNEITVRDFSMMIGEGRWARAANGQVPANALQGGNEASGAPLFICRATYDGGVHTGKVRPGFQGCNVPAFGKEVTVRSYDVLLR